MSASFPAVQLAPIHDKSSIADGVKRSLLLSRRIKVRRNGFENDDVVLPDDVHDVAFDIRQTFFYQGAWTCFPFTGVSINFSNCPYRRRNRFPRRRPDPAGQRGNGHNTLLRFSKSGEGIVPGPGGNGKYRRKVHHHGPRDRHDVVLLSVMCRNEDNRTGFDQCKHFTELHFSHVRTRSCPCWPDPAAAVRLLTPDCRRPGATTGHICVCISHTAAREPLCRAPSRAPEDKESSPSSAAFPSSPPCPSRPPRKEESPIL